MPRALVLGVNGQDGSFLAESLLRRGYAVVGAARDEASRHVPAAPGFTYARADLQDAAGLAGLLEETAPDVVFHVAAVHGSAGFAYEPVWGAMAAVNTVSLHTVLEHARTRNPALRVVYANSAKIFPGPLVGRIDETTPYRATCLYSIGKIASLELIRHYRTRHGIAAGNLFLFNHESRRRPATYFLPRIAEGLDRALADPSFRMEVETLDFHGDWSCAAELMDITVDIAEKAPDTDFVMASGTTRTGREVVESVFAHHGLDWTRHIGVRQPSRDPGPAFTVALDRLEAKVGRRPQSSLIDIVDRLRPSSAR
ncbi:GDP-mannose 4,6-dehydratase [Azospirillum sp. sgz302134]